MCAKNLIILEEIYDTGLERKMRMGHIRYILRRGISSHEFSSLNNRKDYFPERS